LECCDVFTSIQGACGDLIRRTDHSIRKRKESLPKEWNDVGYPVFIANQSDFAYPIQAVLADGTWVSRAKHSNCPHTIQTA
jgi:hypothetical protein